MLCTFDRFPNYFRWAKNHCGRIYKEVILFQLCNIKYNLHIIFNQVSKNNKIL